MRSYQDRHLEPVFSIYLKYLWEVFGLDNALEISSYIGLQ